VTFVHAGTIGTVAGKRDELIARLTTHNETLRDLGCSVYEVGANDQQPDTVFVVEIWDSAAAHQASLHHPEVMAAIADARPLLDGRFGGFRFDGAGSPIRS
jgi:quinol monooxygenase YgiN